MLSENFLISKNMGIQSFGAKNDHSEFRIHLYMHGPKGYIYVYETHETHTDVKRERFKIPLSIFWQQNCKN